MGYQQILLSLAGTTAAYASFKVAKFLYGEWTSPLNVLPCPPSPGFLYGNLNQINDAEGSALHEAWAEEYGSTMTFKALLGTVRLYTTDTKALNHILMDTSYEKPESARYGLARILGDGILVVEGEKHKQQRRIMNPAFGPAQIRELTEIFVDKSIELRDILEVEISKEEPVDIIKWLSKATLDIIGLAGFNYRFDSLTTPPEKNELNNAFSALFKAGMQVTLNLALRAMVPPLRPLLHLIPDREDAAIKTAHNTMNRVGEELLRDSKAALRGSAEKLEKSSWKSRDLLSLLLRANMATDIPANQKMADEDVLAQVPTMLLAGHETMSTSTTWALYALCKAPDVQAKLRQELLSVSTDIPSMDDLNALPYLDAVVRESLRLHTPIPATTRMATKDGVLPLSTPIKSKDGSILEAIPVRKGQTIFVPISALNKSKAFFGEDALEYKPDRWLGSGGIPPAASAIPGVYGQMMTFIGGPRGCIGYRFALVEMKALLFTLVRAFEFEFAVPVDDIVKKTDVVTRPYLKSEPEKGSQLPLKLRPVQRV